MRPNHHRRIDEARDRLPPWRISLASFVLACLVLTAGAYAYFSAGGAGNAEASVTYLPAPTITNATASTGGTVALSWSTVTAPGPGSITYFVSRNGDEPGGNCPDEEAPSAATSCTDSSLSPGTYEYTVTAKWGSWSSTSAPATVEVKVGPVAKFSIKGSPTTFSTVEGVNLTVTALDEAGGTVTSFSGAHSLVFAGAGESPTGVKPTVANSSGTAVNFGTATSLKFTNGVAAAASSKNGYLRIYKTGEASITATEGALTTPVPLTLNVTATASKFLVTPATLTPAAGAADNLTITAQDAYGNTASGYAGTKSVIFSGASESATGAKPTVTSSTGTEVVFGTATPISFAAGVATASGGSNGAMRIYKSGAAAVKATEGSLTNTAVTVTVSPLAATGLTLVPATTTPVVAASVNLTITAKDTYGNTATSYAGPKTITFSGAEASPSGAAPTVTNSSGTAINFGTATALTFTSGVNTISSGKNGVMKLYKAGTANVTATDGTFTTPTVSLTVTPGATSKFVLVPASTTPAAGATDNLTITAQDAYSNTTPAYTGAKTITFSGAEASPSGAKPTVTSSTGAEVPFGTATAINFTAGVATTSGGSNGVMVIYKSGAAAVKATEGTITNTAVTVTVSPLAASSLTLTASTLTPVAAATDNLTLTAKDVYGNVATAYAGPKTIAFSGAEASPSGAAPTVTNSSGTAINFGAATALNFTAGVSAVSGSSNGQMKLNKAGSTPVTASDGTFTTAAVTFTVAPGTASRVAFYSPTVSAGSIASGCLWTCTVTGLGNSGTLKANLAITDSVGNVVSNVGASKTVAITVSGTPTGTVSGSPVSFPETGAAVSTAQFTYTAPSSGSYTNTLTAASTGYTNATATVSK